jgi:hypothetical protein
MNRRWKKKKPWRDFGGFPQPSLAAHREAGWRPSGSLRPRMMRSEGTFFSGGLHHKPPPSTGAQRRIRSCGPVKKF